jgi:OOP family OmpA-OmpF porin
MKSIYLTLLLLLPFANTSVSLAQVPEKTFEKFDFVQGDKILFEDNFQDETPNEIPSFWQIGAGRVEVAKIGNYLCLGLLKEGKASPRIKGDYSIKDKLTFEFDYLIRANNKTWKMAVADASFCEIGLQFITSRDWENSNEAIQKGLGDFFNSLKIRHDGQVSFNDFIGSYSSGSKDADIDIFEDLLDKWVHVSIAINSRSLKLYLNSQRVLNAQINSGDIYGLQLNAEMTSEDPEGYQVFVKNVRVAEGGADPYKLLSAEGKFIARGINFDVAKATLKPESMGAINSIVKMLNNDNTLKFEIGGHTDSDGDDNSNLKLSKDRSDTVKQKLVEYGIDAARLTTKGYGESKPLNDNSTPENKANNRRVEFRKL